MTYEIQEGAASKDVREGLNANAQALRNTRRPWEPNYKGSFCSHNGKDYDLVPGGYSFEEPGNPGNWAEKTVTVESPVTAGSLVRQRGSDADMKALPANTTIDLFIVEGEEITADNVDINGRYWREISDGQMIWSKE
ncbi:hypothetical protein [uncultured Paraglaciecola sp.]|uniref:hypothetical protein n=1 Tax=uncultured Paraglaciecola sp. TaxID=1765024 RepID=UPI00260B6A9A|nr:hypothetical protein [uncultured Paraglaciecola sp.]